MSIDQTERTDAFLPFGAQYYRCPTPLAESWAQDLKNIRAHGFNTIKIWAQWRSNHPQKDRCDFSDLQALMDLAQQNGLMVDINVIMDVSPVWLVREYPDSFMVFNDGTVLHPRTTEYRQIGGTPGPCYHHPQAREYKRFFVEELSRTFAGHPALRMYDLWNEPELTCGLARQPSEEKMSCYCAHSQAAFRRWLEERYGTIESLNAHWQRAYTSFDEVEAPRNPRSFADMMDWRRFFADTLTDDLRLRVDAIRRCDQKTPVMVHTVPIPLFNMVNCCADEYRMAQLCDAFGNSASSDPFSATLTVCAAKGKPVMSAEVPAMAGETFNHPGSVGYEDFKRHVFGPLGLGVKGFLFWQYRCELLGRESPAWGLTDLQGGETRYLAYARRINDYLQRERAFVMAAKPRRAKIAVIKDNDNEVFAWCANATTEKYFRSLRGAFYGFYHAGYATDILTADQITEMSEEELAGYRLLYYPLPYLLNERVAAVLRRFVEGGGTLVSECFFGSYRNECGLHSTTVPGYGFDEVFGCREGLCLSSSHFVNAYGDDWSSEKGLPLIPIGYRAADGTALTVPGYFFSEELCPTTAQPIARFPDGRCAATVNAFGTGQAIMIGTLTGAGFDTAENGRCLDLFRDLAARAGVRPEATAAQPDIDVRVLETADRCMVIVSEHGGYSGPVRVDILSSAIDCAIMEPMDDAEPCPVCRMQDGLAFTCTVQPHSTAVFLSR